jgi:hypothetical protein
MRRRSGISMKMMMKAHTLTRSISRRPAITLGACEHLQTNNAECDDKVGVKDVRNPEREAQKYAQHSGPGVDVSICSLLRCSIWMGIELLRSSVACDPDHHQLRFCATSHYRCEDVGDGVRGINVE